MREKWYWATVMRVRIEKEGEICERCRRRLNRAQWLTESKRYKRAKSYGKFQIEKLGL